MSHTSSHHRREKTYVKVRAGFDATGYMQPESIIWTDGRVFPIEKITDFRPAASLANCSDDCYTVLIQGQEKHLFFEKTDPLFPSRYGRWFVVNKVEEG